MNRTDTKGGQALKYAKTILLIAFLIALTCAIAYAWLALPILTGYAAKDLCSCVMLAGRQPDDVIKNELGKFPISMGSFAVDLKDSSATGNVLGMAKRKAIYRKGLGCTLIAGITESELRAQRFTTAKPPVLNFDSIDWPAGDKIPTTFPANVDFQKLNEVVDNAFAEPGDKKLRRIRAIIVVYDGQIIAEKYAPGFTQKTKQHGWSMTKSITNALVGVLVKQNRLSVDEPAPVAAWKNDERSKITLNHLLQASSGLKWKENYSSPSSATNMLFKKKDMGLYVEEAKLGSDPGRYFYYSSGTPNVITRIIRETLGDTAYYKFPYNAFLYKIGMYNTILEPDAGGTFVGSSYSFGTARDWARFGLLYLNDGVWNGERILPEGWVKYTTTPAPAALIGEYGALFWLNAGATGQPEARRYPNAPTDVFGADGYEGQNTWIIPSKKLVIVRMSQEQGNYLDENRFLSDMVNLFP